MSSSTSYSVKPYPNHMGSTFPSFGRLHKILSISSPSPADQPLLCLSTSSLAFLALSCHPDPNPAPSVPHNPSQVSAHVQTTSSPSLLHLPTQWSNPNISNHLITNPIPSCDPTHPSCLIETGQISAPYNIAGFTTNLYTLSLILQFTLLSQSTPLIHIQLKPSAIQSMLYFRIQLTVPLQT
ncbi:uncharacterized protein LOC120351967 [Nilaparvata lugens]|uniref:uncharacterized protein LOC120351967 n=1 Tax=Nilaparvata lugens TaxID=108931 RepID=UPI00193C8CC7|nr:uncharacterized protein LOC120351967 [Nilaparvata lugens]